MTSGECIGRPRKTQPPDRQRSSLLLANEHIVFMSPMSIKTSALPAFISPAPKRRQLILTDFPRLIAVKEEIAGRRGSTSTVGSSGQADSAIGDYSAAGRSDSPALPAAGAAGGPPPTLTVKNEYVFVVRPTGDTTTSSVASGQHAAAREFMASASGLGGINRVDNIQEKGSKGFVVQTVSRTTPA